MHTQNGYKVHTQNHTPNCSTGLNRHDEQIMLVSKTTAHSDPTDEWERDRNAYVNPSVSHYKYLVLPSLPISSEIHLSLAIPSPSAYSESRLSSVLRGKLQISKPRRKVRCHRLHTKGSNPALSWIGHCRKVRGAR